MYDSRLHVSSYRYYIPPQIRSLVYARIRADVVVLFFPARSRKFHQTYGINGPFTVQCIVPHIPCRHALLLACDGFVFADSNILADPSDSPGIFFGLLYSRWNVGVDIHGFHGWERSERTRSERLSIVIIYHRITIFFFAYFASLVTL